MASVSTFSQKYIQGNYAYIDGVIVDISDPTLPDSVGYIPHIGQIVNNYLFGGGKVYDISDPISPVYIRDFSPGYIDSIYSYKYLGGRYYEDIWQYQDDSVGINILDDINDLDSVYVCNITTQVMDYERGYDILCASKQYVYVCYYIGQGDFKVDILDCRNINNPSWAKTLR